jgi:uncharacterized protein (DUF1501 family)
VLNENPAAYTRRFFLRQGAMLASLCPTLPLFLQDSAAMMLRPEDSLLTSRPGVPEDRVLVVVQLGGGNDGLNTVVPYGDPAYFRARNNLAIAAPGSKGQAVAIELDRNRGIGLHPNLSGLKELVDDGEAAVIQGVGYPNPNRSHFTSMDIWHTGRLDAKGTGWIGRYFDNACNGTPVPEGSVAVGRTAPLAMMGDIQKPVAFESPELFRWSGNNLAERLSKEYDGTNRAGVIGDTKPDSQAAFLMRTALDAQVASDRIRAAVAKQPLVTYPGTPLGGQLRTIAAMIRDGMPTRVYYASISGFDTHSQQANAHGNLLRQVGDSLRAFRNDLKAQGNDGRVLTLVFSEFGRRVKVNGSGGTDHGTAAPMFLIGPMVRPGVFGDHPSLVDLDDGDLKFGVDFRSVYAAVLEDWLKAPSEKILRGEFRKAEVILKKA